MSYSKKIDLYGDGIGSVEYVQHMGTDKTVVQSARVSFGKDTDKPLDEKDKKLIKYLIKHRHTSTLEHCNVTFKFVVPLFIRSQHHRHRTWSYNEWSNRYRDLTKPENEAKFYEPKQFRTQHKSNRQASNADELINPWYQEPDQWVQGMRVDDALREHHKQSLDIYNKMIDLGVCREQARGVLPQNLYTQYYGSTNVSNLLKFIDLRLHEGAQWEIQQVAQACLEIVTDLFPITVTTYRELRDRESHE